MTLPSDPPLPPWPTEMEVHEHFGMPPECWGSIHELELLDREYQAAIARLRVAVEALKAIDCPSVHRFDRTAWNVAAKALALIGPLPESQEGDTK